MEAVGGGDGWLAAAAAAARRAAANAVARGGSRADARRSVDGTRLQAASNHRLYKPVPADMLIRVTLRNLSANPLSFVPVFVGEDGTEEVEEKIQLESGEVREHAGRQGLVV